MTEETSPRGVGEMFNDPNAKRPELRNHGQFLTTTDVLTASLA